MGLARNIGQPHISALFFFRVCLGERNTFFCWGSYVDTSSIRILRPVEVDHPGVGDVPGSGVDFPVPSLTWAFARSGVQRCLNSEEDIRSKNRSDGFLKIRCAGRFLSTTSAKKRGEIRLARLWRVGWGVGGGAK